MEASPRILVVEDEPRVGGMFERVLAEQGADVVVEASPRAALARADAEDFGVVLVDIHLGEGEMSGFTLTQRLRERCPDLPVVLLTADCSVDVAVAAVRSGAFDFLRKPVETDVLWDALHRAMTSRRLVLELRRLRTLVAPPTLPLPFAFIGSCPPMRRLIEIIARLRGTLPPVVITGEAGTGKTLAARALHATSGRAAGPLIRYDCASGTAAELASQLVDASGGTLVLAEVGALSAELQTRLLVALRSRAVRRTGAAGDVAVDARIICLSRRDLAAEVEAGRFHEELYHRLGFVTLAVPPLRARSTDLLELANHLLIEAALRAGRPGLVLSSAAADRLLAYDWPGNVRELAEIVERAALLVRAEHGDEIEVEDLDVRLRTSLRTGDPDEILTLDELERRHIWRVLHLVHGNKTRAAELLGLDRRTLYRKLERAGE